MPHKKKPLPKKNNIPIKNSAYYQNLLLNPNINAYLLTIRRGEGTLGDNGYYKTFGGGSISTLDVRPAHKIYKAVHKHKPKSMFDTVKVDTLYSSAVGAFQFLNSDTHPYWDEQADAFGWDDILPVHQEIGALHKIDERHAIEDIMGGDIVSAISKTGSVWASLPGSNYHQPTQKLNEALAFYQASGGALNGVGQNVVVRALVTLTKRTKHGNPKAGNNNVSREQSPWNKPQTETAGQNLQSRINSAGKISGIEKPQKAATSGVHGNNMDSITAMNKRFFELFEMNYPDQSLLPIKSVEDKKNKLFDCLAMKTTFANPGLQNFQLSATPLLDTSAMISRYSENCVNAGQKLIPVMQIENPAFRYGIHDNVPRLRANSHYEEDSSENSSANQHLAGTSRTLNIHFNTPLIGDFTINATDTSNGITDLKSYVEEALLEILNSANAIQ